jgi:hypothetical protein
VRRVDDVFVAQLRIGAGQHGSDVLGGDIAQQVADFEGGFGVKSDGTEVLLHRRSLERVVVLAGGGEEPARRVDREPALHAHVCDVAV